LLKETTGAFEGVQTHKSNTFLNSSGSVPHIKMQ